MGRRIARRNSEGGLIAIRHFRLLDRTTIDGSDPIYAHFVDCRLFLSEYDLGSSDDA
jgi:hypothetical protein